MFSFIILFYHTHKRWHKKRMALRHILFIPSILVLLLVFLLVFFFMGYLDDISMLLRFFFILFRQIVPVQNNLDSHTVQHFINGMLRLK